MPWVWVRSCSFSETHRGHTYPMSLYTKTYNFTLLRKLEVTFFSEASQISEKSLPKKSLPDFQGSKSCFFTALKAILKPVETTGWCLQTLKPQESPRAIVPIGFGGLGATSLVIYSFAELWKIPEQNSVQYQSTPVQKYACYMQTTIQMKKHYQDIFSFIHVLFQMKKIAWIGPINLVDWKRNITFLNLFIIIFYSTSLCRLLKAASIVYI